MRKIMLAGIAALGVIATTQVSAQTTTRSERRVIVVHGNDGEDAEVYQNAADRYPAESDYRGRWNGEWQGQWEAPDGQVYRGTYRGEYDGDARDGDHHGEARYREMRRHHAEDRGEYRGNRDQWSNADWNRFCTRDDGVGGALLGGVIGGVAGNRIAGRGDRTVGTIIGGVVGAAAGAAIDRSEDRRQCQGWWANGGDRYYQQYRGGDYGRYESYGRYEGGYDAAYSSGYYGYAPGATTTIVIPGQPIIIEETETTYETVTVAAPRARVAPRRPARRAARPVVRRPRCTCR